MNQPNRKIVKKLGTCEVCDTENTEVAVYYGNIAQCDTCYNAEQELLAATGANRVVIQSQKIDSTVDVKSDLFNAATVSIIELHAAMDADPTVSNVQYALASEIKSRLEKFDTAIFAKQDELAELNSARRAHVTYLNDLASKLRIEERNALKLQDISYVPTSPKITKIKQAAQPSAKAIKVAEIRALAVKYGLSEETHKSYISAVQMLVNFKGWDMPTAAKDVAQKMGSTNAN